MSLSQLILQVFLLFQTLRIVDKRVTDVDGNFLYFVNLDELTLSANYLRTVNSGHLPSNLKVLELCANQISNLADLCMDPPPLIHLGLGYNKLHMIDDYITGIYWPTLLSLDLSFNNLNDLLDIIRKLQTLPKLRNLLLHGNPLSLVPAYRGYAIDSLRKLEFLDGVPISADDKHKYKGLAKRKEFVLDEAKMTFKVDFVRGIPIPEEIMNPEDQPEFPIITRTYFVQFMFLEDSSNQHELLDMVKDQQLPTAETPEQMTFDRQSVQTENKMSNIELTENKMTNVELPEATGGSMKNVNFASQLETANEAPVHSDEPEVATDAVIIDETIDTNDEANNSLPGDVIQERVLPPPPEDVVILPVPGDVGMELIPPEVNLAAVDTNKLPWEDEVIQLDWWQVYTRDDLLGMRNFLKKGMEMKIMEEKILSYPAEPEPSPQSTPDPDGKSSKGKKDDKKKDVKPDKGGADKKKKKKGEPDVELQHMPAEYRTLASFHIPLSDFLENECFYETVYIEGGMTRCLSPVLSEAPSNKKDGKNKDKKNPGTGKKGKDDAKGKKSPDKRGGKDGKKGGAAADDDDELAPPPPPLEVHVAIRLHQWKTAMESLKEETAPSQSEPEAAPQLLAVPNKK